MYERRENWSKNFIARKKDCVIAGTCGGIAEYFDVGPNLVRIIAVLTVFLKGLGLTTYIIAWIAIPRNPELLPREETSKKKEGLGEMKERAEKVVHEIGEGIRGSSESEGKRDSRSVGGLILVGLGLLFLAINFSYWFDLGKPWPVILVITGLTLVTGRHGGKKEK